MGGNFAGASGDLYRWLGISPSVSTGELRTFLSDLEGSAVQRSDAALCKRLQTAYAVLGSDQNREVYHSAVRLQVGEDGATTSLPHSWEQLAYLGNFGRWPEEWEMPAPEAHEPHLPPASGTMHMRWQPDDCHGPSAGRYQPPPMTGQPHPPVNLYSMSFPGTLPGSIPGGPRPGSYQNLVPWQGGGTYPPAYRQPRNSAPDIGAWRRATVSARLVAGIIDSVVLSVLYGAGAMWDGTFAGMMIVGLLLPIYYIVCDYKFGGTLGKKAMGVAVQDVTTGERLTLVAATQRNLWRLVTAVPLLGTAISPVVTLVIAGSIAVASSRRGMHDTFANAEVVRKEFVGIPG